MVSYILSIGHIYYLWTKNASYIETDKSALPTSKMKWPSEYMHLLKFLNMMTIAIMFIIMEK